MTDREPSGGQGAEPAHRPRRPSMARMPQGSVFYERIVPILLVTMGVVTLLLILFAVGVLLGVIPWR